MRVIRKIYYGISNGNPLDNTRVHMERQTNGSITRPNIILSECSIHNDHICHIILV